MPSFSVRCDTQEKINLFKDILEKIINESSMKITKGEAMSFIFDFYLENYKISKRSRELIRRSEYNKKKTWRNELTKEIREQEHQEINFQMKHILNNICKLEKDELKSRIRNLINANIDLKVENEKLKYNYKLFVRFKEFMKPIIIGDEVIEKENDGGEE